jgi:lysophospholipase L1-like esterase
MKKYIIAQLPEARNQGISGDITFGVLQRLDEVTEGHPAKVFILIGLSDPAACEQHFYTA